MSETYNCVNCQCSYNSQELYKNHYKSEHHRYNVKRKLIGLIPLQLKQYQAQFQVDLSSKSSTQKELHCQICSKKFMSINTYKQHMNSQKHKINRKKIIKSNDNLSQSSSSNFSIIGMEKGKKCMFCQDYETQDHLLKVHNFPPFKEECINIKQLCQLVQQKIAEGKCIYCNLLFQNTIGAKQHMMDLGHCKLNIDDFNQYQKFYLWKIQETSSEEQQEPINNNQQIIQDKDSDSQNHFQKLKKPTLKGLNLQLLGQLLMENKLDVEYQKDIINNILEEYVPKTNKDNKKLYKILIQEIIGNLLKNIK